MCDVVYVMLLRERQEFALAAAASGADLEQLPDARESLDEWLESDAALPRSGNAAVIAEIEQFKRERGIA